MQLATMVEDRAEGSMSRRRFIITITAMPADAPADLRVRRLLTIALRQLGLKCVAIIEAPKIQKHLLPPAKPAGDNRDPDNPRNPQHRSSRRLPRLRPQRCSSFRWPMYLP